ncbi:MFS transporter [Planctomicrobium sp. SH661]|uniref:MFS transporter n=1 Tax=Planctomicrobium sp. SH661 TaxID=3448124 RepID=UPI003F5C57E3
MTAEPQPSRYIPHLRWWIVGTCFLGTTINYIDRLCLSVSAPALTEEFHFSNADYSSIVNSFVAAYTIMQIVSGRIVDWIGVRRAMALFATWWAVAGILHGFAVGLWSFRASRFLLGMGEAGNWPAATRAVSEWFPPRERSFAVAIFDSGSGLGGILAPPLIAWLIIHYGWQSAFFTTGTMALFWVGLWLWIYRSPETHPRLSPAELKLIRDHGRPASNDEAMVSVSQVSKRSWKEIFTSRNVWGISLGRFLTDCTWWFYVYWLPKYLADAREMSLDEIARFAWIPFIAADFGNLGGGWLSGKLIQRGWSINSARKLILACGAIGMTAGIPAGFASDVRICIFFISLAVMSYSAWGTMLLTLPTDLFPSRLTGSVSGFSGACAGLGGILFTWMTGEVVDHYSYTPVFVLAGLLPLLALFLVLQLIPRIPEFQPR